MNPETFSESQDLPTGTRAICFTFWSVAVFTKVKCVEAVCFVHASSGIPLMASGKKNAINMNILFLLARLF